MNGTAEEAGGHVVVENTVNLKKTVGLISGTSLIVGTVIGKIYINSLI